MSPAREDGGAVTEVIDLLEPGEAGPAEQGQPGDGDTRPEDADHHSFAVTIRTPAGHEHLFRVAGSQRVSEVTKRTVAYFVAHGELADGRYVLAVLRDGQAEDMVASSRLEDYGVRASDVLVLIPGEPQVDG